MEALESGKEPERIFLQKGAVSPQISRLKTLLQQRNIVYTAVPAEKLNRLAGKNHQGAVCILSSISYQAVESLVPTVFERGETPLFLLLDRITDVRNFGAICRTAECAGAHAVIIPSRGSALINADAVKTSAGALLRIPVAREHNLKETIHYLKTCGIRIIACTEKGSKPVFEAELNAPCCIVLGSEEDGISPEYLKLCDEKARIPMIGKIASLNVSVAAGIALFEAVRQRGIH